MEGGLGDLRESFATERAAARQARDQAERGAKKASLARKGLTDNIEKTLLRRYERVRKRVGGIGFVAVRERRCTACKMAVAHQTYVSLRNAEMIPVCESCGRLLYWANLFPDENKPVEPKAKDAPTVAADDD